jgi:cobalt-zinc-cadmium efflux system outer membrane protein
MSSWQIAIVVAFVAIPTASAQQPTAPPTHPATSDTTAARGRAASDSAARAAANAAAPRSDTAGQPPLDRRSAVAEALAHNPQLAAAREQIAQAHAQAVQATAIPDPGISAAIVGQNNFLRPHTATEHDIAVGLTIPFPDKLRLRGQVSGADVRTAELAYSLLRQQIASQVVQTYDSLLVAQRHVEDFREGRQLAQDFLARTEARFNAGTDAKLDVVKARVDLAQATTQIIASERDVANARASLNRLLGRSLAIPLRASDTLAVPPQLAAVELFEKRALAVRPEVQTLAAQRRGASAATALAKEYWVPDISLSVSHNTVDGAGTTYDTGIGIGIPLFFWQHSRGEVAEAQHRERELAATARDLSAQVSLEVRTAYATATTAVQQVIYLRDELVPEARQAYTIAASSYRLGGSSALEVLDAQRTLLDAQTQYAAALAAANDAMADLERATGTSLATSATSGGPRDAR